MPFGRMGARGGFGSLGLLGGAGNPNAAPAWMPAAAKIGINYNTQQYFVRGTGFVPLSSLKTFTRAGSNTVLDSLGNVTTVGANLPAISDLGLQDTWEARTNLLKDSDNLASANWVTFVNGTGTISRTANSAVAPDGTTSAVLLTIFRSDTASYAIVDQSFTGTAARYSGSIWLKAAPGHAGKNVHIAFSDGTGTAGAISIVLQSNWTRYTLPNALLKVSASCQLTIGYTGGFGIVGTGSTSFYAWRGKAELGTTDSPDIPTTAATVTRSAPTWTATGALATLLAGATGGAEILINSSDQNLAAQTLIDANGTVLFGKSATNNVATAVGASLASSNVAAWLGVNSVLFSWNASGGLINTIGTTTTDAVARTPTGPFNFYNTAGANYWNGNIGIELYYDTKQTAPQVILPSGVMPGFITRRSADANPAGTQFRDFSGMVLINSGAPLFLGNTGIYDTFGTNTPYISFDSKNGGTYIALTSTAINTGGLQDWQYLARYTSPDGITWTNPGAGNPVVSGVPGGWNDKYMLHPAVTRDCALAPWVAYFSANTSTNSWRIGYATSTDGVTWTRNPTPVITNTTNGNAPNPGLPSIITIGSTLHMYTVDNGNAGKNIVRWTSPISDGVNWTYQGVSLGTPAATDWDGIANAIIDPWVIKNKRGFYEMTYTAIFGNTPQQRVGYAISLDGITFYKYTPGPIQLGQFLAPNFCGDPVMLETASNMIFIWDEDNGTNASNPYGKTLPPY